MSGPRLTVVRDGDAAPRDPWVHLTPTYEALCSRAADTLKLVAFRFGRLGFHSTAGGVKDAALPLIDLAERIEAMKAKRPQSVEGGAHEQP